MNILKKVLAITLTFALSMTMFTFASATTFTDQSKITNTEAVGMLTTLGIIKGNSDGSFAPNNTVTRGEMAKMIYVLRTGEDDGATAYSGLSTTFKDIDSTWAAPYIKYCASLGIISGRSSAKFAPNDTVTGLEATKMLLVCIGYDASKAGLVGSSWASNTAALGSDNALFKDVDQNTNTALTRQYAAQVIYNAIDANTVAYDSNGNVQKKSTTKDVTKKVETYDGNGKVDGYTTVVVSQTDYETVGEKYLDLAKTIGVLKVSGNAYLSGYSKYADDEALYVISDGNSVDEGDESSFSKVDTDYSDLLGCRVEVLYKKNNTDEVYGVYAMDENKVDLTTTASKLDNASSGEQKVKVNGTKYKIEDDCKIYVNNEDVTNESFKYGSNTFKYGIYEDDDYDSIDTEALSAFIDAYNENNGTAILISNDDNDKIDVIRLYTKQFAQVTSVTSKGIYLGTADCSAKTYNGTKKFLFDDDEVEYYHSIASDDYVFIDHDYYSDKAVITKADIVTGELKAYSSTKITIDGTAYNYVANTDFTDPSLGHDYTIYVDGTYAYAVDGDTAASIDSALITAVDSGYSTLSKGIKAVLLFDDNTTKNVIINNVDGTSVTSTNAKTLIGNIPAGTLIEYDTSSSKYQVTVIDQSYSSHKYTAINKTNAATTYDDDDATIANYEIADDAIIYVGYYKNDTDKANLDMSYKAVSGSTFSNYSETKVKSATSSLFLTKESSNVDYVQLGACIIGSKLSSTGNTVYGYVLSSPSLIKNSDDDTVSRITVWNGTKEETLTCDDNYSNKGIAKGTFVSYEKVNGTAFNVEVKGSDYYAAVRSYSKSKGRLTFYNTLESGLNYAKLVDDSQIVYFDAEEVEGCESGDIAQAFETTANQYTYNVVVIPDEDNEDEIAGLFVDINKDLGKGYCSTSLSLNESGIKMIEGNKETLTATRTGEISNDIVTWSVVDNNKTSVVTVDSEGVVTAVGAGTATVRASCEDGAYTADCLVTVEKGLSLDQSEMSLIEGKTKTLTATKASTLTSDITWSVVDNGTSVVTVDANGVVTAIGAGTATVRASCEDGAYTADCEVTVEKALTVTPSTLTLIVGETYNLTGDLKDTSGEITWGSNKNDIATVNNGVVTAIGAGTAIITASSGSYSDSCTVTVEKALTLNDNMILAVGGSATLTATKASTLTDDIVWTSSDDTKVKVTPNSDSSEATITVQDAAVVDDQVTITATCGIYSVDCMVTVGLKLDQTSLNLKLTDSTVTLTATKASTLTDDIVWTSSDDTKVTVTKSDSSEAIIKVQSAAVVNDQVTITATCGTLSVICTVNITE